MPQDPFWDAPVSMDPTHATFVAGLTSTLCGEDDLLVYGGHIAECVWRLHLPTATWTEIPCGGSLPIPRVFHAACHAQGYLAMCGGELLASDSHHRAEYINYYELNLETYDWSLIECFGAIPFNRSHHTLTAVGNRSLVLLGGKPIIPGPPQVLTGSRTGTSSSSEYGPPPTETALSSAQLTAYKHHGFYDIFVFELLPRTWRRVEIFDPVAPCLWGHSAVMNRDTYLFCYGGFDVSQSEWRPAGKAFSAVYDVDEPPAATLSDSLFALDIDAMRWHRFQPPQGSSVPTPRALHGCAIFPDAGHLFLFGGLTVDRFGRSVLCNDAWSWRLDDGRWKRMEFCLPQWPSSRLVHCVYGSQWIICPRLDTAFYLDTELLDAVGWQRFPCTVQRLSRGEVRLQHAERDEASSLQHGSLRAKRNSPKGISPLRGNQEPHDEESKAFGWVASPPHSISGIAPVLTPAAQEVLELRSEVSALREHMKQMEILYSTRHSVDLDVEKVPHKFEHGGRRSVSPAEGTLTYEARLSPLPAHPSPVRRKLAAYRSQRGAVAGSGFVDPESAYHPPPQQRGLSSLYQPSTASLPLEATVLQSASPAHRSHLLGSVRPTGNTWTTAASQSGRPLAPASTTSHHHPHPHQGLMYSSVYDQTSRSRSPNTSSHPPTLPLSGGALRYPLSESDTEDIEDIKQVANLGLELHRATLVNAESRRLLLIKERKDRIQQLQERLKFLEEQQQQKKQQQSADGAGSGGNSADAVGGKSSEAIGLAMKQSEKLRRLIESQASGHHHRAAGRESDPRVAVGDAPNASGSSEVSSLAVAIPPTHDPPETLRSSSCLSSGVSSVSDQRSVHGAATSNTVPTPPGASTEDKETTGPSSLAAASTAVPPSQAVGLASLLRRNTPATGAAPGGGNEPGGTVTSAVVESPTSIGEDLSLPANNGGTAAVTSTSPPPVQSVGGMRRLRTTAPGGAKIGAGAQQPSAAPDASNNPWAALQAALQSKMNPQAPRVFRSTTQ